MWLRRRGLLTRNADTGAEDSGSFGRGWSGDCYGGGGVGQGGGFRGCLGFEVSLLIDWEVLWSAVSA